MALDLTTRWDFDAAAFDSLPPDKRRQAIRAMAELQGGQRNNPLFRFDPMDPRGCGIPHMPQHRFLRSWKTPDGRMVKFMLLPGGNRGGKTTTGDVKDIIDCIDRDAVPPHLQAYKRWEPPFNMFLVTPSDRATRNIHLPIMREWCPKDQLVGNSVDKAFNKEYGTLSFKNGSTIQFMTQRMETEVFQGVPLHRVHFDEEPLHDSGLEIFTECMQRVVDYNGDVVVTFTPLNGMTWLYDKLWLPWAIEQPEREAAVEGFSTVTWGGFDFPVYCHVVDQDDNPVIDKEGQAAAMAMARNDEERRARKSGRFVSFAGKIYSDFARDKHVVPDHVALSHAISPQVILGGLDPGFRHMAGGVFVSLDDEGVWVLGEVAEQKTVIGEVAKSLELTREGLGLRPIVYIADPAIARVDHQTGKSDQQAYLEAGVQTRPGNNAVPSGIKAIQQLLLNDRLHIAASCEQLIEQFNRYRWKSTGRSEDDAPARPVKRDDHLLDALRYAIMSLPLPEVAPEPDLRTTLQRAVEADIERAMTSSQSGPAHGTIGAGQFD